MSTELSNAISRFHTDFLNHSAELFSAQVVSVAAQLSKSDDINIIHSYIEPAFKLIEQAKQIVYENKMKASQHRR